MHAETNQPHMTHLTLQDWSSDLESDATWQAPRASSIRNVLAYSRGVERQTTSLTDALTHLN